MRLSRKLYDLLRERPEFEVLTQSLSITTFRYMPPELRARRGEPAADESLNQLNEELLARINKSGEAFFSNAVIDDKFALRACIVNFRTTDADIEAVPDIVAAIASRM
jgi:glutamate/tyrosine decarboxylase-like PLP-dependent enzyme